MAEVRTDCPKISISIVSLFNCKQNNAHPAFNVTKTFKQIRHRTAVLKRRIKLNFIGI